MERFGRTPNDARRVSTSVLFTRGILVSAVRRSASGVLSTRSRISVGGRCSDCLNAVRYWPASSGLHARARVCEQCGVGMWFRLGERLLTTRLQ